MPGPRPPLLAGCWPRSYRPEGGRDGGGDQGSARYRPFRRPVRPLSLGRGWRTGLTRMGERDVADHAASNVPGNKTSRRWIWLGGVLGAGMALAIVLQLGGATDTVLTT